MTSCGWCELLAVKIRTVGKRVGIKKKSENDVFYANVYSTRRKLANDYCFKIEIYSRWSANT